MTKIINFSNCELSNRNLQYGGRAGEIQSGNSEKEEQLCESISGKCAEAVTFSG